MASVLGNCPFTFGTPFFSFSSCRLLRLPSCTLRTQRAIIASHLSASGDTPKPQAHGQSRRHFHACIVNMYVACTEAHDSTSKPRGPRSIGQKLVLARAEYMGHVLRLQQMLCCVWICLITLRIVAREGRLFKHLMLCKSFAGKPKLMH